MALFTWDQIANQLTDGYWNFVGGTRIAFDVTQNRDITVDLSRLSPDARTIALNALSQWAGATGINFIETSTPPTIYTETTDVGGSRATALNITTNSVVNGNITSVNDVDYYRVTFVAGQTYLIGLSGYAAGSGLDAILELQNSAGDVIRTSDDPEDGAVGEYITFTATAANAGTYYITADGYGTGVAGTGAYQLSVQTAADITFNDMDPTGAYAYSNISGNTITQSFVNIPDVWQPLTMNGYMLQTYIHEIGHALGLGHAGNYNGTAEYPANALYDNDSWLASVMSYFSQTTNTLVANDSYAYLATIMPADIIAIQTLYGAGTTGAQTGNTTWGPGGNLNNTLQTMLDMAAGLTPADPLIYRNEPIAFTIYDTGGTDTLNLSAFNNNSEILLTELQYSNVAGLIDNVVIARGTVIENAIGGAAGETIVGNAVANVLEGRGGSDTMNGGVGTDTLIGGSGNDVMTGGADNDSFIFNASELAAGQSDTITDFAGGAAGTGDSLRLVGVAAGNVAVAASGGNATLSYGNGTITNTVLLQTPGTNPIYVNGYSSLANAQSGNLANGFTFISDAMNEVANTWTRQIRSFDAAAALDWISTFNDDGSRLYQDLDNLTNQTWSNVYESYDTLNRIASRDTINDDGSRSKQFFDNAGLSWTSVIDAFSAGNVLQNEVTTYDNGTRTASYFDWENNKGWSSIVNTFSATNTMITETITFDGGSRSVQSFDHLANQGWSSILQNFDNINRLMNETTNYDNGTRQVNYFDYQTNQTWTTITDLFSSGGVLQSETTTYDNGTRQVFYNDWETGSTNIWTSITNLFDSQNRLSVETVRYDNGNMIITDFDQNTTNNANGEYAWAKDVYTYNSASVLIQHYQIMDDGSTVFL